ncbi:MAG TPA: hypothetical protein VK966_07725 [Longimicrobiales bacterium]|nr:hypothetical protein [Longimicrobiales bacterium]
MELVPWVFILVGALLNLVLIVVGLWFAWVMVTSVRGIHQELKRIRQHLAEPGRAVPGPLGSRVPEGK